MIAADFSPAMLGTLDAGIEYYGLEDLITPLELAWMMIGIWLDRSRKR